MMEKLWGDNFFDPATKKWTKKDTNSGTCKRGFVQFIYEPIKTIIEACMNDNKAKLWAMTDKLGITGKLKSEDKELTGKQLMKRVMQSWLPASEVSPSAWTVAESGIVLGPAHHVLLAASSPCTVSVNHQTLCTLSTERYHVTAVLLC